MAQSTKYLLSYSLQRSLPTPGLKHWLLFTLLTKLQFEQCSVRTGYLYPFQYHAGWLEAGSDSQWRQKLSEVLAHSLVKQLGWWDCRLGPQLELLIRSPASDLSMWLLGFPTAWCLGSESKCPKTQEVEAASFSRPGPKNWHGRGQPHHILLIKLSQSPDSRGVHVDPTSHWKGCQRIWWLCFSKIWGHIAGTQLEAAVIITVKQHQDHHHLWLCFLRNLRKSLLMEA